VLIVVMQAVSTVGMLVLPTLNADIVDNGLVKGDTGHILRTGGLMLVVALVQAAGTAGAIFYGARMAMAVGRDIRVAIFDRVQAFSARETGRFGIPSLITRTTNDVQQVQMVALLTFTSCPPRSCASAVRCWPSGRTRRCPRCCWSPCPRWP
jgi:ATP-binding cassette subfamily B multidrug efflux pump